MRSRGKWSYNKAGQLAVFGDNILNQLGGHIGVADVDRHHITSPSQRMDLGLDRFECFELTGRNHDCGTEAG